MHTFPLHGRTRWVARPFSRNPLVRWTDRIEACAIQLVILLALAAAAVCAVAAVGVYRSHTEFYAEQSRTRHAVTATVVETAWRPRTPHTPHTPSVAVLAMWLVGGDGARGGERDIGHSEWINTDGSVKVGERLAIWLDDAGVPVAPPTPPSQAVVDAAGVGVGTWCGAALGLVGVVGMVRWPLNRIRRVQWEREIEGLAGGGLCNWPR
jgi:hypothetical protein